MNVGSMTNSGLEIDVNWNILRTKDINWDILISKTVKYKLAMPMRFAFNRVLEVFDIQVLG